MYAIWIRAVLVLLDVLLKRVYACTVILNDEGVL